MTEADKMFEELGYEKHEGNTLTSFIWRNETEQYVIMFRDKQVIFDYLYDYKPCYREYAISMQELKAINEKCKELGWLDQDYELDYWDEKSREEKLNND